MYDHYEYGENSLEVDMYIEDWQIEKGMRREANYNNHIWRTGEIDN
tara:strand:+ start:326 stop:463 length:138 start_codon:yes stop_codon:yes gene_type:complete